MHGSQALAARFGKYLELARIDAEEYAETWGEAHHMAAEDRRIIDEAAAKLEAELSGMPSPRGRTGDTEDEPGASHARKRLV